MLNLEVGLEYLYTGVSWVRYLVKFYLVITVFTGLGSYIHLLPEFTRKPWFYQYKLNFYQIWYIR